MLLAVAGVLAVLTIVCGVLALLSTLRIAPTRDELDELEREREQTRFANRTTPRDDELD